MYEISPVEEIVSTTEHISFCGWVYDRCLFYSANRGSFLSYFCSKMSYASSHLEVPFANLASDIYAHTILPEVDQILAFAYPKCPQKSNANLRYHLNSLSPFWRFVYKCTCLARLEPLLVYLGWQKAEEQKIAHQLVMAKNM